MTSGWRPLSRAATTSALAEATRAVPGVVRVAIDGPPCADPDSWADELAMRLQHLGRPVAMVRAEHFWRDRSLRLEYGHEDADAYAQWLDHTALRREVLDPAVTDHRYLPSLRDPATDRSTHASPAPLADDSVVIVSGALLFGLGLPFETSVHLAMSPAARRRHTPDDQQWTLPAFDDYDAAVTPTETADVVVKLDDPARPAVRGL